MAAILTGKRLALLKQTLPDITRVAVLWDRHSPGSVPLWQETLARAQYASGVGRLFVGARA
jgi:putative tryptophan/tyrosine transport system substrate-binding protein